MDRCALFVDAGYVLADGAMAVHGTRRRESVSWDYGGLLQLLGNLAMERSGLPLLRCYWYESAADGRRSAEQEALADMPGVKLRLVKARPGHEGVEGEMHRDLTALARNQAVSDAMVVSSAEELTRVVADVQDLGMRVTLLHIAADGNWTISRTLRQECDDIVEITPALLRPYVELISGAEPPRPDERDGGALIALRPHTNGHVPGGRTMGYAPMLPSASPNGNGHHDSPVLYTEPVIADYDRPALQIAPEFHEDAPAPSGQHESPAQHAPPPAGRDGLASDDVSPRPARHEAQEARHEPPAVQEPAARRDLPAPPADRQAARRDASPHAESASRGDIAPMGAPLGDAPSRGDSPARDNGPAGGDVPGRGIPPALPVRREFTAYQDLFAAPIIEAPPPAPLTPPPAEFTPSAPGPAQPPVAVPVPQEENPAGPPASSWPRQADVSGYNPGAIRDPRQPEPGTPPHGFGPPPPVPQGPGPQAPVPQAPASLAPALQAPVPPAPVQQPGLVQPGPGQPPAGQSAPPAGQPAPPAGQPAPPGGPDVPPAPTYTPSNGSYSGPPPTASPRQAGSGPSPALNPNGLVGEPAGPAHGSPVPPAPAAHAPVPPAPAHAAQPAPGQPSPAHPAPVQPGPSQPMPAPVSAPHGPAQVAPVQDGFGPPSYEQPSYEEAQYEEPSYEEPSYGQPEYPQPGYGQPEPGYGQPEFARPEFGQPGYGQPGGMNAAGQGQPGSPPGLRSVDSGTGPMGPGPEQPAAPGRAKSSGPLHAVGSPGPAAPAGPGDPPNPSGPMNPGGALAQPAPMNHQANQGAPAGPGGGPVQAVPAFPAAAPEPSISLADAVQSAHEEGQEFGGSVARDAPTLWLEAVLARKPRMPSDLEARLLQGSSLPIDFLLHDEVRHALRRGFWDALERARR